MLSVSVLSVCESVSVCLYMCVCVVCMLCICGQRLTPFCLSICLFVCPSARLSVFLILSFSHSLSDLLY